MTETPRASATPASRHTVAPRCGSVRCGRLTAGGKGEVWLLSLRGIPVLSIGKLVSGQERYYEGQVAQGRDDYHAGRGEAEGRWVGAGATALGLEGDVDAEAFGGLIAGRDPNTGEVLRAGSGRDRVC